MDVADKTRLEKLLGMLGSSFDGERANAARMIAAMAEKKQVTIAQMVMGPGAQARAGQTYRPRPKKAGSGMIAALLDIASQTDALEFVLTEWECQFASDVSSRYGSDYELSEKQTVVAQKIIDKVEAHRKANGAV